MALLKKRPEEQEPEVLGDAVAEEAGAPVADAAPDVAPVDAPNDAVAEAPADPLAPSAAGGDALLQMFEEAKHEGEDRSMFVDMAGDVDLADLMEELATTAAALGIVVARAAERSDSIAA
jgi:hypothetical protein